MYFYHALINALSAQMIHINLNTIFYTRVEHLPNTVYIRYYTETHTHTHTHTCTHTYTHTHTHKHIHIHITHRHMHTHTHMHTMTVAEIGY